MERDVQQDMQPEQAAAPAAFSCAHVSCRVGTTHDTLSTSSVELLILNLKSHSARKPSAPCMHPGHNDWPCSEAPYSPRDNVKRCEYAPHQTNPTVPPPPGGIVRINLATKRSIGGCTGPCTQRHARSGTAPCTHGAMHAAALRYARSSPEGCGRLDRIDGCWAHGQVGPRTSIEKAAEVLWGGQQFTGSACSWLCSPLNWAQLLSAHVSSPFITTM